MSISPEQPSKPSDKPEPEEAGEQERSESNEKTGLEPEDIPEALPFNGEDKGPTKRMVNAREVLKESSPETLKKIDEQETEPGKDEAKSSDN